MILRVGFLFLFFLGGPYSHQYTHYSLLSNRIRNQSLIVYTRRSGEGRNEKGFDFRILSMCVCVRERFFVLEM